MKTPLVIAMSHLQFPVAICTQYACIFDLTKRKQTEHWPPNFQSQLNKLMAFLFMHYNSYSHIFYFWSHSLSPSLKHFPACRHKHKQFTCVLIFHEFSQFLWLIVFIWFWLFILFALAISMMTVLFTCCVNAKSFATRNKLIWWVVVRSRQPLYCFCIHAVCVLCIQPSDFFFQSTINPIQRVNFSFLMCMNFYLFYHANIIIQFLKVFFWKALVLYQHKKCILFDEKIA